MKFSELHSVPQKKWGNFRGKKRTESSKSQIPSTKTQGKAVLKYFSSWDLELGAFLRII